MLIFKILNLVLSLPLFGFFIHPLYIMALQENLLPTYFEKILGALKAEHTVKRITFVRPTANPGETLYVSVPKLNENDVIVPESLALLFDIDLSGTGSHTNNFLIQSVSRALVDKLF